MNRDSANILKIQSPKSENKRTKTKDLSQEASKKKKTYLKLQFKNTALSKENKRLQTEIKKIKTKLNENNENTSSNFFLISQIISLWNEIAKDTINSIFIDFFDYPEYLYLIIKEILYKIKLMIDNKINSIITEFMKNCNLDNSKHAKHYQFIKNIISIIIKEFYFEIFEYKNEEKNYKEFKNYIFNYMETSIYPLIKDNLLYNSPDKANMAGTNANNNINNINNLKEDFDDNFVDKSFKNLFFNLQRIIFFLEFNNQINMDVFISSKPNVKQEDIITQIKKDKYLSVEGVIHEDMDYIILIDSPKNNKGFFIYKDLKPIVISTKKKMSEIDNIKSFRKENNVDNLDMNSTSNNAINCFNNNLCFTSVSSSNRDILNLKKNSGGLLSQDNSKRNIDNLAISGCGNGTKKYFKIDNSSNKKKSSDLTISMSKHFNNFNTTRIHNRNSNSNSQTKNMQKGNIMIMTNSNNIQFLNNSKITYGSNNCKKINSNGASSNINRNGANQKNNIDNKIINSLFINTKAFSRRSSNSNFNIISECYLKGMKQNKSNQNNQKKLYQTKIVQRNLNLNTNTKQLLHHGNTSTNSNNLNTNSNNTNPKSLYCNYNIGANYVSNKSKVNNTISNNIYKLNSSNNRSKSREILIISDFLKNDIIKHKKNSHRNKESNIKAKSISMNINTNFNSNKNSVGKLKDYVLNRVSYYKRTSFNNEKGKKNNFNFTKSLVGSNFDKNDGKDEYNVSINNIERVKTTYFSPTTSQKFLSFSSH